MHTLNDMYVVWDPKKAKVNLKKHGVDFTDAAVALEDENALTILDTAEGEYRYNTLARGPSSNVLYVVHIEQDEETVRIISARSAEASERNQYFTGDFYE